MSNSRDAGAKTEHGVAPFFPPPARDSVQDWRIDVYNATHERERWQRYMDAGVAPREWSDFLRISAERAS